MTGAPRRPVRDKRAFYPPWPRRARRGHPGAAPAPGLSSRLSFSLTRAHVRNPSHRPDRPSPGHGAGGASRQACAGILAGAGYYLAAGPWHEPASGPGLHALAPAAARASGRWTLPACAPPDGAGNPSWKPGRRPPVRWTAPCCSPTPNRAARPPATSPTSATRASPASRRHAVERERRQGFLDAARTLGLNWRPIMQPRPAAERRPDGLPAAAGHQYPVRRRVRQFGPAGRLCPRPTTAICMCRRMSRCWDCQRTAARGNGRGPEHPHGQRGGLGRRAGLLLLERLAGDRGPGARIMLEAVLEARLST